MNRYTIFILIFITLLCGEDNTNDIQEFLDKTMIGHTIIPGKNSVDNFMDIHFHNGTQSLLYNRYDEVEYYACPHFGSDLFDGAAHFNQTYIIESMINSQIITKVIVRVEINFDSSYVNSVYH